MFWCWIPAAELNCRISPLHIIHNTTVRDRPLFSPPRGSVRPHCGLYFKFWPSVCRAEPSLWHRVTVLTLRRNSARFHSFWRRSSCAKECRQEFGTMQTPLPSSVPPLLHCVCVYFLVLAILWGPRNVFYLQNEDIFSGSHDLKGLLEG